MYICICGAVPEKEIRKAIAQGTDTWKKLCHDLNIAQQCGVCAIGAKALFESELAKKKTLGDAYVINPTSVHNTSPVGYSIPVRKV